MNIPLNHLGLATATVSFFDHDPDRKKRGTILTFCLKNSSTNQKVIVEALMYCLDFATTTPWLEAIGSVDRYIPQPYKTSLYRLLYWLEDAWKKVVQEALCEDCLEVVGETLILK